MHTFKTTEQICVYHQHKKKLIIKNHGGLAEIYEIKNGVIRLIVCLIYKIKLSWRLRAASEYKNDGCRLDP